MLPFRFIALFSFLLVINACSSTLKIASAHYFRYFDFNTVHSYAFYDRNDEQHTFQNMSDVTRNSIELAIENELDQKHFTLLAVQQADIIVSYFWYPQATKNRDIEKQKQREKSPQHRFDITPKNLTFEQEIRRYNQGVRYCAACLKLSDHQEKKVTIKTAPGYLVIDLIDPKSQRSVWRSSYYITQPNKQSLTELQMAIKTAIQKMLAKYP